MLYYFSLNKISGWHNTDGILSVLQLLVFAPFSLWRQNQKVGLNPSLSVNMFVCLFGDFRPTRQFFTHIKRHICRWRAANFDLCSALMAIEQWGFLSVPHQLWYGASVYDGYLFDTPTYCRTFGSGAVTICFYDLGLSLGF